MKKIIKKYSFVLIILLIVLIYHHSIIGGILESNLAVRFSPDTQYILSVIEWNQYSLLNESSAIYHLNYFYPNGYVTFYGHPLFGESLVFLLLNSIAGISLINTYNIYLLLAFWIGGIGVFLFGREVLGSYLGGIAAAAIYIFFPHWNQIANILNIFSFFWIGYVLYFIVKFYREKKWKYAFYSGVFIFCQGLFSIYHGFFLMAILLPLLFLLLLIFRKISFKGLLKFAAAQIPFIILLILIFHPFLTTIQDSNLKRAFDYESLIDSTRLFNSNSLFYSFIHGPGKAGIKYFPGFISILLALFALIGTSKEKIRWIISLSLQTCLIYFLNFKGFVFIPNLIILFLVFQMLVFLYLFREKIEFKGKIFFFLFIFYFLVFFKFSSIFGGEELSIYGGLIKVVPSFKNFRFLYRGILVLLPVFSVIVAIGLTKLANKKKEFSTFITILILLLIGVENYSEYKPIEVRDFSSKKYESIPRKSDKVILELPIFKPGFGQVRNSRYTINTRYHYNYYVNGRTAYRSFGSNTTIFNRIMKNPQFPNRKDLKFLIENYSVDYVIINNHKRFPLSISEIQDRVATLPDMCRIIDKGEEYIVLEIKDMRPQKKFIRSYSPFHLKNRKLHLLLNEKYTGKVSLSIKGKTEGSSIKVNDSSIVSVSFPDISPAISGEKILIKFDSDVSLEKIELVKKN